MTATLLGLSLASPEISIAAAEDGAPSSSAGSTTTDSDDTRGSVGAAGTQGDLKSDDREPGNTLTRPAAPRDIESDDADDGSAELDEAASRLGDSDSDSDSDSDTIANAFTEEDVLGSDRSPADHNGLSATATQPDGNATTSTHQVVEASAEKVTETPADLIAPVVSGSSSGAAEDSAEASSHTDTVTPSQSVVVSVNGPDDRRQWVADQIAALMGTGSSIISVLPVGEPFKTWLYDSLAGTRRTLFNQAPWLTPIQLSGEGTSPIVGTLGAVDLEGDAIRYEIVTGPSSGTLVIDGDGKFTYVPNAGFTGIDSFVIAASDIGAHFNLLDPFRAASSLSSLLVNQSAVSFLFNYTTGSQYWTPEARSALQRAASNLLGHFIVTKPVIITYEITGQNSSGTNTLASVESPLISSGAGFFPTVVQHKLLTGVDANGVSADGQIDWNFAYPWAFGDPVAGTNYDFTTVAMHELLHSFGFMSYAELSTLATRRNWTLYDSFLLAADGTRLIGTDYQFNSARSADLRGANGGVRFGGAGAADAYGALVPLYTPATWVQGSSISHVDSSTFTGPTRMLMNPQVPAGPGPRTLSAVERGIMADLGYTLAPMNATSVLAFVAFVFLRRKTVAGMKAA